MQYRYRKIDLEQFAILSEDAIRAGEEVVFRTDLEFGYDKENRLLSNRMTVTSTSGDKTLMKAVMTSYFEISEDSLSELKDENDRLVFDPMSLVQFASLNYGSLRGAMYIKTYGTNSQDIVLPPVYFHKIITSAFIVE